MRHMQLTRAAALLVAGTACATTSGQRRPDLPCLEGRVATVSNPRTQAHDVFYRPRSGQETFLGEVAARSSATFNLPDNAGGYVFARPARWVEPRAQGWNPTEEPPVRVDVRCDPL